MRRILKSNGYQEIPTETKETETDFVLKIKKEFFKESDSEDCYKLLWIYGKTETKI